MVRIPEEQMLFGDFVFWSKKYMNYLKVCKVCLVRGKWKW